MELFNELGDATVIRGHGVWRAILVLALVFSAAKQALPQESSWKTEEVGHGVASSMALDGDSNLHIVYLTADAQLMYGFRAANSTKWYSVQILPSTHAAQNVYPRIAVDSQNRPRVCVAIGKLQYLSYESGSWRTEEVDPDAGTLSYHCSIALAKDGTPHIIWYHEFLPGGKQFSHVRHAELADGLWVVRSIDGGISGKWNSMVIDSKGYPEVTYSQWSTGGDIRFASWNGKDWKIEAMPSDSKSTDLKLSDSKSGDVRGYDNSLALAKDGSPHISYFDESSLRYAHRKDGKWVVEKVTDISAQYDFYRGSTAMLLDSHENPHIVYGDFGAVKHAYWNGKEWQVENVVSGGLGQYANVDAAMGADDTLYISYPDPSDGLIKVATSKVAPPNVEAKK